MYKQVIVLRSDLGMQKGKLVAQGAHASLCAYLKADDEDKEEWEASGQKKVALKVNSEKELLEIFKKAKTAKLPTCLIRDAGHTQVTPGSVTAVGIGPAKEELLNELTGSLKLL